MCIYIYIFTYDHICVCVYTMITRAALNIEQLDLQKHAMAFSEHVEQKKNEE